ncbi:MAG: pyridoxal kinase PdxY [Alphaproteobacteria bacterium]|nr:pyridoxal kinase PdxY [Alphaproteobacteria bacterium]
MGHVGNAAAVLPLQRLGHEVWAVPTVLYSNHPAHGGFRGRVSGAGEVTDLVAGLDERGALVRCAAVLSGYLGSAQNGAAVGDAVALVKRRNPDALYLCDPVMGHEGAGFFVPEPVRRTIAERLIPAADIATPNHFELAALVGAPLEDLGATLSACRALRARGPETVICTSVPAGADHLATLAVSGGAAWRVETPRLAGDLFGAGDLFAALFLGHYLARHDLGAALGAAITSAFGVLVATAATGKRELRLIAAQDEIVRPRQTFVAVPVA